MSLLPPYRRWALLLVAAVAALAGCARLQVDGRLKTAVTVQPVGAVLPDSPLACAPIADRIAYVDGGLRLSGSGSDRKPLTEDSPTRLAWSPDGRQLAAAFVVAGGSAVRLFAADGTPGATRTLPGSVTSLAWNRAGEVLVATLELTPYAFGGNLRQAIHRWNGRGDVQTTVITDSTLMRKTMQRWGSSIPRLLHVDFSPGGDAVVFSRFRDPPAYAPFLQLILRHLDGSGEVEIAVVPLVSSASAFAADGELLLYGNGRDETVMVDPWGERQAASFPLPGRSLAVSPSGKSVLIDGHLFRDGEELLILPAESAACFSADTLVVRSGETLYLIGNLPAEGGAKERPNRPQRQKLRKWRAEGLITPEEYRQSLERM